MKLNKNSVFFHKFRIKELKWRTKNVEIYFAVIGAPLWVCDVI